MKQFYTLATLFFTCAVVSATDMTVTNTAPENGDRSPQFEIKSTKALAELNKALLGFGTNRIQIAGTISVGDNYFYPTNVASNPLITQSVQGTNTVNSFPMYGTVTAGTVTNAVTAGYTWAYGSNTLFRVNGGSGTLQAVVLTGGTNSPVNLLLWSQASTVQTPGSAFVNSANGPTYKLGTVSIASTDYIAVGTNYCATKLLTIPVRNTAATNLIYWSLLAGTSCPSNYPAGGTNYTLNLNGIGD